MKTSLLSFLKQREKGFTLLEIIVTLTIAAILGTILVTYMGTALTKSGEPVVRSKQMYELQQVMENIKATYIANVAANDALSRLEQFVCPGATGGTGYKDYGSYKIETKRIVFESSVITGETDNYVESVAVCSGSDCSLKVTVTSNIISGLSVTEVFAQRPTT